MPYEIAICPMDTHSYVSHESSSHTVLRLSPGSLTLRIITDTNRSGLSRRTDTPPGVVLNIKYRVFYSVKRTTQPTAANRRPVVYTIIPEPPIRYFAINHNDIHAMIGNPKGYGGRLSLAGYELPFEVRRLRRAYARQTLWEKYAHLRKVTPMADVGLLVLLHLILGLAAFAKGAIS